MSLVNKYKVTNSRNTNLINASFSNMYAHREIFEHQNKAFSLVLDHHSIHFGDSFGGFYA